MVTIAKALGDPLRANILRVLAHDSFGVQQLVSVFDMAQPALSHHLKLLLNAGLVSKRKEGTSVFYQRQSVWGDITDTLYEALDAMPVAIHLQRRVDEVNHARNQRSLAFFNANADALTTQQQMICEPRAYQEAVLSLAAAIPSTERDMALEVGPGRGDVLVGLSQNFKRVVGVDNAREVLRETRTNITKQKNIELVESEFSQVPKHAGYNLVVAAMVIHHLASPRQFFAHAARILKPGAQLIVVELLSHAQEWVKECCGDLWLGFSPEQITDWCEQTQFRINQHHYYSQNNGFKFQVVSATLSR